MRTLQITLLLTVAMLAALGPAMAGTDRQTTDTSFASKLSQGAGAHNIRASR